MSFVDPLGLCKSSEDYANNPAYRFLLGAAHTMRNTSFHLMSDNGKAFHDIAGIILVVSSDALGSSEASKVMRDILFGNRAVPITTGNKNLDAQITFQIEMEAFRNDKPFANSPLDYFDWKGGKIIEGIQKDPFYAVGTLTPGVVAGFASGGSSLGSISIGGGGTFTFSEALVLAEPVVLNVTTTQATSIMSIMTGGSLMSTSNTHKHHTIPKEIQKKLPDKLKNNKDIVGRKGLPNRTDVEASRHLNEVHKGPRGGAYNHRFEEEIMKLGGYNQVTTQDILEIRDALVIEFKL